jgi:hypothetical protein
VQNFSLVEWLLLPLLPLMLVAGAAYVLLDVFSGWLSASSEGEINFRRLFERPCREFSARPKIPLDRAGPGR